MVTEIEALLAAGKFRAALALLQQSKIDAPLLWAQTYIGLKRGSLALNHLNGVDISQPNIALLYGQAYLLAGQFTRAIEALEPLLNTQLAEIACLNLITALRLDAQYMKAITLIEKQLLGPQLLYHKALCYLALGNNECSMLAFTQAIALQPNFPAAYYASHGLVIEYKGLEAGLAYLERASQGESINRKYRAMRAAYAVLSGAKVTIKQAKYRYLSDGAAAIKPYMTAQSKIFGTKAELLRYTLSQTQVEGTVAEFGVRRGASLAIIADLAGQEVHGFDSFTGLPEAWGALPQGIMSLEGELPCLKPNVVLHQGWFKDTIEIFQAQNPAPIRFANIDCDLYQSTKDVLLGLKSALKVGTILVFDECIGYRDWQNGEYRALIEMQHPFTVVAVSLATKQLAIRLI